MFVKCLRNIKKRTAFRFGKLFFFLKALDLELTPSDKMFENGDDYYVHPITALQSEYSLLICDVKK